MAIKRQFLHLFTIITTSVREKVICSETPEIVKAIRFVDEVIPYKAVDEIEKANKRDVGYYGHR